VAQLDFVLSPNSEDTSVEQQDQMVDEVIERTDETTRVVLPVRSIDGSVDFVLKFEQKRLISGQGQITFYSFIFILIFAALATMLAIRLFMRREVIDVLNELADQMKGISGQEQLPDKIEVRRDDEIGALAKEFELMLNRLKQDQAIRNEAVQAMTETLADARRAEQLARLGTYEWDWTLSRMVACSDEFARIREMTVTEVLQTHFSADADLGFIHPDDRDHYQAVENESLAAGKGYTIEYRLILPSGTIRHIREVCEVELDDQGRVTCTRGSSQDVTEQIQLEDQLRQSQKLEAIGKLTGGIAHDFNNILTVIMGNLELALNGLDEDHPLLGNLNSSLVAADHAAKLVQHMLAYARKQPLRIQVVELRELLLGMQDILKLTLGEAVELELQIADRQWLCETDAVQLESAMLNLAINARDAMTDGCTLSIRLDSLFLDEDYTSAQENLNPGHFICITVSDTGSGMPSEIIGQVFDPFFTTKEAGEGTGLGLSMVYGFIKQCHGKVSIASEPNQGTSVKMYLPEYGDKPIEPEATESQEVPQGKGEVVLVVEDEPAVRELVVQLLSELGYETREAENADEAMQQLSLGTSFDLLFTDVVLPGSMSGVELAQTALDKNPELKVLLTSGYPRGVNFRQGSSDYALLKKPYTHSQLARTLSEVLAETAGP
jgi:signal transduction histidine kinase/CheY-like chemotaxis protein/HAMP domain-containing protein|tara:strand:+ start:902 stop:2899 length:1998 start_codon:yes stop_codon:yes gene_type:complete